MTINAHITSKVNLHTASKVKSRADQREKEGIPAELLEAIAESQRAALNVAVAPSYYTENQKNPRLTSNENFHLVGGRDALWGAEAVAELLRHDAFHKVDNEESGEPYTGLDNNAVHGLHMALKVLMLEMRSRIDRLVP